MHIRINNPYEPYGLSIHMVWISNPYWAYTLSIRIRLIGFFVIFFQKYNLQFNLWITYIINRTLKPTELIDILCYKKIVSLYNTKISNLYLMYM